MRSGLRHRWSAVALSVAALLCLAVVQGCVPARGASAGTGLAVNQQAPAGGVGQGAADSSEDTETADRLAYAVAHGGRPHRGETLYLLTIASEGSETAARTALDNARPLFSEDGDTFVVQESENFEGMEPGRWIVVEAFSSGRNADGSRPMALRATTEPRIDRVVVRTDEPIPVYEEVLLGK